MKLIKKTKEVFQKKENLVIFFGIFCTVLLSVFIFWRATKAECPDAPCTPAGGINVRICTDPPEAAVDVNPSYLHNTLSDDFIVFTTSGNSSNPYYAINNIRYAVVKIYTSLIDDNHKIYDTGSTSPVYDIYAKGASADNRPTPRCPCDTAIANDAPECSNSFFSFSTYVDPNAFDPPLSVAALPNASDPGACYDWYVRSYQVYDGESCTYGEWFYSENPYCGSCGMENYEGQFRCVCCISNYHSEYANASYQYNKVAGEAPPGTYAHQLPSGLMTPGSTYRYRVAAYSVSTNSWSRWATGLLCNHPPTITPQTPVQPDYCVVSAPAVTLSWTFTDSRIGGDTLSAYQVQISEYSDFSTLLVDSGKVSSGSNTSFATSAITWGKTYYWRVKAWDSCDVVSNGNTWANGPSFSTISHAKPRPDFNWFPVNPAPDETVLFRDQSVAYGGYAIADNRVWSFQDSTMVRPHEISPIVKFTSLGAKTVTLTATDTSPEAFTCTASKTVNVGTATPNNLNLPCWREINPR